MVGDPRDRTAYGVAFASLGLALAITLIGVCWLSTERGSTTERIAHRCERHAPKSCRPSSLFRRDSSPQIPTGLWVTLALLGGLFVGALIPFPLPKWRSTAQAGSCAQEIRTGVLVFMSGVFLLIGLVAVGRASEHSLQCCAIGGLLLGLLVPSPAREE
jgi:hypothetical protein